jgi:bifunctional UDP-N-acetylglucosamine pyrophosphorylase/glucosamine-1-phosphate N-acetyltransferase
MVLRVVRQARKAGMESPVVVVGHGRGDVIPLLESEGVSWEIQEEQLGTAHAVRCGLRRIDSDSVTVLLGDVPLLESGTIAMLEESRRKAGAAMAVLTTRPPDPTGYGRIIRDGELLKAIVEDRDCSPEQLSVGEINTGLMSFDGEALPELLGSIGTDNDQGEYYLTDAVTVAVERGLVCVAVEAGDYREVSGVNDRIQLSEATEYLRRKVVERHLLDGVGIPDPNTVWIEESVTVGCDVTLGRFVRLSGKTTVGDGSLIGDGCVLVDCPVPAGTSLEPYTVSGWRGSS